MDYDDYDNVCDNVVVQKGLSVKAVGWAFTHAQVCNWVPLTTLSHMLDCQIFTLRAGGHHMVNVLLHAATAVLLFLVLRQMTGSQWRSAFVAAVFAVHPLRVESVAWVSERKDVLSGLFFVLTVGAYVRYVRQPGKPSRTGYLTVALLFGLGLLAKTMVATLPLVLLLLDYWPLGRFHNQREFLRLVREKLPLLAIAAAACGIAALMPGMLLINLNHFPLFERIGNAVVSYVVYLRQTVFPAGLATPYAMPPHGQPIWLVCMACILLVAITAGVIQSRKKSPFLLVGWLWYLAMLLPVIGIIQISSEAAHADRYTYLPGIGLVMALTWAAADASKGWMHRRLVLGGLMLAAICALAVCARAQTSYWRDEVSLWTRAVDCDPENYVALNYLGAVLAREGKPVEGITYLKKALAIRPGYAEAHNDLGTALVSQGKLDEAVASFQKALAIQPSFVDAHCNLANVLVRQSRLDDAIAHYRMAAKLDPDNATAQNNLGQALLLKGDAAGAMASLEKAAALFPDPVRRWCDIGNEFLQAGKFQPAILFFRQATKAGPRFADAWDGLGTACSRSGQAREAVDSWQKALEINPNHLNALNNLALFLATASDPSLRNPARAVALATKAGQLSGEANPVILRTLAAAYASQGDFGRALPTARRALELAVGQKQDPLAALLQQEIAAYGSRGEHAKPDISP